LVSLDINIFPLSKKNTIQGKLSYIVGIDSNNVQIL
jgi:hypothetical protein